MYAFNYRRARTLDDAAKALAQDADAKVLAGGQSLIAAMKLRLAHPSQLIDRYLLIEEVADLLKGKAQITKGDEPVETGQLSDGVQPIPGGRLDPVGPEQADLVVVAQHAG